MAVESKKITVRPGSDMAHLLEMAVKAPVLLEKDGVLFRVNAVEASVEEPWARYDPTAALAGMRAAAGSWADLDAEELKANIYRGREEGTRPATRP